MPPFKHLFFTQSILLQLLFFVSGPKILKSQGLEDQFSARHREIFLHIFPAQPDHALQLADSLYKKASNPVQRIQALHLMSMCNHRLKNFKNAISIAIKAQHLAYEYCPPDIRSTADGFLANTLMSIGLLEQSKRYLSSAEKNLSQSPKSPIYTNNRINILHDKVRLSIELEEFKAASQFVSEASALLLNDTAQNPQRQLVGQNQIYLESICHLKLGHPHQADSLIDILINSQAANPPRPYLYHIKSEASLLLHDLQAATKFKTLMDELVTDDMIPLMEMYDFNAKYYAGIGNLEESAKWVSLLERYTIDRQRNIQRIWKDVMDEIYKSEDNSRSQNTFWYLGMALVMLLASAIYIIFKRRTTNKKRFKSISENSALKLYSTENSFPEKRPSIATDTEARILKALDELEKNDDFMRSKNISLSMLAHKLETNERYLSHILRTHRNNDFYHYIQHYRVHFLLRHIQENPEMLDYKLAYWSEIAGFANPAKFSTVFKSVTGLPPSLFADRAKKMREASKN